ncbi:unnamed protein product [Rhizoctonia solani]|uniref:ATP citrate synthase n=1 Tax=Rhizoctonia solani TaxID=456999 RepID=A0A8H3DRK1_9AGAM|nr:unnamed protein product [Rhizoctonia solani]
MPISDVFKGNIRGVFVAVQAPTSGVGDQFYRAGVDIQSRGGVWVRQYSEVEFGLGLMGLQGYEYDCRVAPRAGALDEAAAMFSHARYTRLTPRELVDESRKANKLISGIGHRIKSANNPDLRVELVKEYVLKNFPSQTLLDYALAVEQVTTAKKDTQAPRMCFVDLLRDWGSFIREEADEYIKIGTFNGLFVLDRSIGFTGRHLERLRAPLYRHPADNIFIKM